MKEWLTPNEIVQENLPGLPTNRVGLLRLIEREAWNEHPLYVRQRQGRGGGCEYHFKILPTVAMIAWQHRHMQIALPENVTELPSVHSNEGLSERAQIERDARLAIVHAFNRYTSGLGRANLASKTQIFCDNYRAGKIQVDDWIKETVPSLSKRTLLRWRKSVASGEANTLATDRAQSRKGTSLLETANEGKVLSHILALIAKQPHLTAKHVHYLCRDEFGDELVNAHGKSVSMPPVRTFQHSLKRIKLEHKTALLKITNPDKYRSHVRVTGTGSLRHINRANQLWQIDASPVDALCVEGRHSMYSCLDIATRREVILVSRTPRASAVALLIRKAILAWGVPEVIKTDNGSDFVAQDTKRLFAALDIEMDTSDAYSPQQKGHVERAIKTFQHSFAPLLPGYVGHNPVDRKEIEERKSFAKRLGESVTETFGVELTGQELQEFCDQWIDTYYQHQPHGGLKGLTPFQKAFEAAQNIRSVDARALDLLLMPVPGGNGIRTVAKTGIRVNGYHYLAPGLFRGDRVFVRQDPNDAGRILAFEIDGGKFLGEAICAELAGIDPARLVAATREINEELTNRAVSQIKRDMRELTKGPALIERVLNVAAKDAPNVVSMPRKSAEYSTPQIEAAIDAISDVRRETELTERDREIADEQRRMIAETDESLTSAPETNVTKLPESPKQRYRRAVLLQRAIDAGEAVDPEQAVWLGQYQTTPEFKGHEQLLADFGDQYLGL